MIIRCLPKFTVFFTNEEFIEKAQKVHQNKYDYSKVNYVNTSTKVCIICKEHGEFWQKPNSHLSGQGCPKCGKEQTSKAAKLTTEQFISKARKIHGDKYDYSKTNYDGCKEKLYIVCHEKDKFGNEHGGFWQTSNDHLSGCGCPKCRTWKLEEEVSNWLIVNNITFDYHKNFTWLNRQSLDFFLPDYKIAIEEECDIYISGDAPHHVRREIVDSHFNYLDMPHEIEHIFMPQMKKILLNIDPNLEVITFDHEQLPKIIID